MILRLLFCLFLLVHFPLTADAAPSDPWSPRQQCVFGMPYLGQAVMPQQAGTINKILQLVYEPEDVLFRHVRMPYARALDEVAAGHIHMTLDLLPLRKGVLTARAPLATYDLIAVGWFDIPFRDVSSLRQKRVAYLHGLDLQRFIPVPVKPLLVYDLVSGFHLLDRGRVDFLLGDKDLIREAMLDAQQPEGRLVVYPLDSYLVRPIFTDSNEGRKLRDIYNRRIKELILDGEFQTLLEREGMTDKDIRRLVEANK